MSENISRTSSIAKGAVVVGDVTVGDYTSILLMRSCAGMMTASGSAGAAISRIMPRSTRTEADRR